MGVVRNPVLNEATIILFRGFICGFLLHVLCSFLESTLYYLIGIVYLFGFILITILTYFDASNTLKTKTGVFIRVTFVLLMSVLTIIVT